MNEEFASYYDFGNTYINEAASFDTTAIVKGIYPMVSKVLGNSAGYNKYKNNIGKFINARSKELYDIAPYTRIYWSNDDKEDYFKAMGFKESDVLTHIQKTYYYPEPNFNPRCAKDPFTCTQLMAVRYFMINKKQKELDLAMIYLAFSGSFYPSVHFGSFPTVQPSEYRHVMEYVVNNCLSQKFDLKREGSVIGAVRSICKTWIDSYSDKIKSCSDEDVVYVLQQLHDRIKSFMINIATIYYDIYKKKDVYLAYNSDSAEEDSFRVADNDSLKAERYASKTMTYITTHTVNYQFCRMATVQDSNVKTEELKSIIESIQETNENLLLVKEYVNIMIISFLSETKAKEVTGTDFMVYAITPKPNTKNKNLLRQKEILEQLLNENSASYRKRKSRLATQNSYHRCVASYYALVVNAANK